MSDHDANAMNGGPRENDDLERDFFSSPGEHLDADCWCRHPRTDHRFDPARDYRELMCDVCKREQGA